MCGCSNGVRIGSHQYKGGFMVCIAGVGAHCQRYRANVLGLTLEEMSSQTGVKLGTLSAFEQGRSSNINHVFRYCQLRGGEERDIFIFGLMQLLKGVSNEKG